MRVCNHIMDDNGNYETGPSEEHVYGPPRTEHEWEKIDSFRVENYYEFISGKTLMRERFTTIHVKEEDVVFVLDLEFNYRNTRRYHSKPILFYESIVKNTVANAVTLCILPLWFISPMMASIIIQMTDCGTSLISIFIRGCLAMMLTWFGINASFLFYFFKFRKLCFCLRKNTFSKEHKVQSRLQVKSLASLQLVTDNLGRIDGI